MATMTADRIFLDTNVLISAVIKESLATFTHGASCGVWKMGIAKSGSAVRFCESSLPDYRDLRYSPSRFGPPIH